MSGGLISGRRRRAAPQAGCWPWGARACLLLALGVVLAAALVVFAPRARASRWVRDASAQLAPAAASHKPEVRGPSRLSRRATVKRTVVMGVGKVNARPGAVSAGTGLRSQRAEPTTQPSNNHAQTPAANASGRSQAAAAAGAGGPQAGVLGHDRQAVEESASPTARAQASAPVGSPALSPLLEAVVSAEEAAAPGAPRPLNASQWRRLWDPLTATEPRERCIDDEFLGETIRHTTRTELCQGSVAAGEAVVCYQPEGVAIKACEVRSPVVDATGGGSHSPFLRPRCDADAATVTSTAIHALHSRRAESPGPPTWSAGAPPSADDEWIVPVHRDCGPPRNNPYHCLADVVAAYLGMRTFGAPPERTRVVFTDRQDKGVYEPLWRAIGGLGVHDAAEWAAMLAGPRRPPPPRSAIIPMRGPSGPLWYKFWEFTECESASPLLTELRGLVLASVLGQGPRAALGRVRSRFSEGCGDREVEPVVVTVASRRVPPSGMMQRMMDNEGELVEALAARLGARARVQAVDLSELPSWREQLRAVHGSTVLVGMHGAALVWSVFMDPGGGVVELHQGMGDAAPPKGIGNAALHAGLSYARWRAGPEHEGAQGGTRADVEAVATRVEEAVEEARRFCRALEGHVEAAGGAEAVLAATEAGAAALPVGRELVWAGRQHLERSS